MPREDAELLALLVDLESDQVERKASLAAGEARTKVRQAICAFANDLPGHRSSGVIFIGAADDGRTCGLPIDDQVLRNLASMRDEGNIRPRSTAVWPPCSKASATSTCR